MKNKPILSLTEKISYFTKDSKQHYAHLLKLNQDIETEYQVLAFKKDLVAYFSSVTEQKKRYHENYGKKYDEKYGVIIDVSTSNMVHDESISILLVYYRLCDNNDVGLPGLIVSPDSEISKRIKLDKVSTLFHIGTTLDEVLDNFRQSKE